MNLKDLIEKHTVDGKVNFEDADKAFQNHINGVVKKNTTKEMGKFKNEFTSTFISELGIEANDLDGVKKWAEVMNGKGDDFQKESAKLKTQLDEQIKANNTLQTEYTNFKQDTLLAGAGLKGEQAEFYKYKFNKNISDDVTFESQLEDWKKENKPTTYKAFDTNFQDTDDAAHVEALRKLRKQ